MNCEKKIENKRNLFKKIVTQELAKKLKCCISGEISPNLVTLIGMESKLQKAQTAPKRYSEFLSLFNIAVVVIVVVIVIVVVDCFCYFDTTTYLVDVERIPPLVS